MKLQSLVFMAATLATLSAFAVGKEGGGGQGILCTYASQKQTLVPLDLYEAQGIWGAKISASGTLQDEIKRVLPNYQLFNAKMAPNQTPFAVPTPPTDADAQSLLTQFNQFSAGLHAIPANSHLSLSDDNGGLILQPPSGCQLVQVLFDVDEDAMDGQILADTSYWNLLSPQSQLAFFFHETIYKRLRFASEETSARTRRIVGMLFDQKPYPGPAIDLQGLKSAQYCTVKSSQLNAVGFYAIPGTVQYMSKPGDMGPNAKPGLRLVFDVLSVNENDLLYMLVNTTADSMWTYDEFSSGHFQTGPQVLKTESILGSATIRVGFTDKNCNVMNPNKKCQPTLSVLTQDNKWVGGPVTCSTVK